MDKTFKPLHIEGHLLKRVTVQPVKEYVKPANQLRLSEAELEEDLACSLSSANPNAPSNIARFVQKDSAFKASSPPSLTSVCACRLAEVLK